MSAKLDIEQKIENLESRLESYNGYVEKSKRDLDDNERERNNILEEIFTWKRALKAIEPKEPMR